jgi:nucleoid-associated protein EbfC
MSDNQGSGGGGGGGGLPDLSGLLKAAQRLQGDVVRMQEDLVNLRAEATSGGGMVTAVVNGHFDVVSLRIEKDVVDPGDVTMLQDLVAAAVNQANAKMRDVTKEHMAKAMGGLNIPGMPGLF